MKFYPYIMTAVFFLFLPSIVFAQPKIEAKYQDAINMFQEMHNEALELIKNQKYNDAIDILEELVKSKENLYGKQDPSLVNALYNLAAAFEYAGKLDSAEHCIKRVVLIELHTLGSDHPDLAQSNNLLANILYRKRQYNDALALYKKSLNLLEAQPYGYESDIANIYNNLEVVYESQGNFREAEKAGKLSLEIREKLFGSNSPQIVQNLVNLAYLYLSINDSTKADENFKRALTIEENIKNKRERHHFARILSGLAVINVGQKHGLVSKELGLKAVDFINEIHGDDSEDYAVAIYNLGLTYYRTGDIDKAEECYNKALSIWEKYSYQSNIIYALYGLSVIHTKKGNYAKAEKYYKRCINVLEISFGSSNKLLANCLNDYAILLAAKGEYLKALEEMARAQSIYDYFIGNAINTLSDDQKYQFMETQTNGIYSLLSLVTNHLKVHSLAVQSAFDVWIKRKGIILEAQKNFQESLLESDNKQIKQLLQQLNAIRTSISQCFYSKTLTAQTEKNIEKIQSLISQKQIVEQKLIAVSESFALIKKRSTADCDKIKQILSPNTALIDFARIPVRKFDASYNEKAWLSERYVAFVLQPTRQDYLQLIDLGEAKTIDKLLTDLTAALNPKLNDQKDIKTAASIRLISHQLYSSIFAPIRSKIDKSYHLIVSPDGSLNLLPFEILPDDSGRYLIQDYIFSYISSSRDLLGLNEITHIPARNLIIGNPDYNLDEQSKQIALEHLRLRGLKMPLEIKHFRNPDGLYFTQLPGTQAEIDAIRKILGEKYSEYAVGKEALEELLVSRESPKILHIATHGFFLKDQQILSVFDGFNFDGGEMISNTTRYENPLIKSGIALAGANNKTSKDTAQYDGILTAEKILNLRLLGTELVVLSSCSSGLGDIMYGEGVFGLRRSFMLAGAKGLVMSMWSVPDNETRELMESFYRNRLSGFLNNVQSLRMAELQEMETVQNRYGHSNPFYWGAFIYEGKQ